MGGTIEQVVKHMANHAAAIDQIGDAARHHQEAVGHAKGLTQLVAAIDKQGEGQAVALGKALVAGRVIAAHPPDHCPQLGEAAVLIAEGADFHRAAGGFVFGIEKQHQGLALELVAAAFEAVLVDQGHKGSPLSGGERFGQGDWNRCLELKKALWLPGAGLVELGSWERTGCSRRHGEAEMAKQGMANLERAKLDMAKLDMSSDLIAQPSFWPELEPATPGPRLRQPKPAAHAPTPGLDLLVVDPADPIELPAAAAPVPLPSFRLGPADRSLPERLLILDTETTGLQSERDQCIEIGAVLFHVAERAVLEQVSFLLPCQENPAEAINGISASVTRSPQPWQAGLCFFEAMLAAADLVVAHNVKFDRAWFGREPLPAITKPWLCTMEDIRWPSSLRLKPTPSVRDLALAFSVPVWAAHRALTDCIYLAQVFERCGDLDTLVLEGLEPRQLYRARLSYAERHRAREAGFRWNEPLRGAWSRRLSQRELALLSFPVELVDGESDPAI